MSLKFSKVNDVLPQQGVKCLIYGDSGVGKTVLCATAPNAIIISCEAGLLSLKESNLIKIFGKDNPTINYNMPVIEISTIDDLVDVLNWATDPKNHEYFDTICIDSLTEIAEVVLNNLKSKVKDPRQAYAEVVTKMDMIVRGFRDIKNKNVVMLAKIEVSKDEVTGVMHQRPQMPGRTLGGSLPYYFDMVFKLGVQNQPGQPPVRFLQTERDFQSTAKDRSGTLNSIEEANLTNIFNKIKLGA